MEEKNTQTNKSEMALREEAVLEFWKENNIFGKSLEKDSPQGEFVFYDGPPTANGKPGIHHLEPQSFKDAIPRYKTMRGYHVRRKGGWDTHGLPVELEVEKELGLKSKKEIEEYGIAEFNKKCKESVWKYVDLWYKFRDRVGYWVDKDNPYITYDKDYMESLFAVVKKIDERGLLYKDYKVLPWCPRCGTALSSHELAQGYKDVKDISVYVKFKISQANSGSSLQVLGLGPDHSENLPESASIYFLAWTTTPWTLPGNVGLAVGEDITYVKIKKDDELLILAKDRLSIIEGEYETVEEIKGKDLIGIKYEALFPYIENAKPKNIENAYKVYGADFVTTTDGTGIVHTAVMYGQEDFDLGTKVGLPKYHLVDENGNFVKGTDFLEGRFVKEKSEDGKPTMDVDIIKYLQGKNLFFKKELYEHSYPHCWRCKTPLIYYARDSWYVRMSELREDLIKENQKINWEPAHIREGRFGEWIREVKDWAFSRERYWGTPLPVWTCEDCGKNHVIGSVADLRDRVKKSGNKYFIMRHGEADHNISGMASADPNEPVHLTEKGREQVRESAQFLKDKNIDLIISSPFVRTRETSEGVCEVIDFPKDKVIFDERLREIDIGVYNKGKWADFHKDFPKTAENFSIAPEGGESFETVKDWMMNFMHDVEIKFQNKNILIVTHGGPAWLALAGSAGFDAEKSLVMIRDKKGFQLFSNAEIQEVPFVPFPHNERWELDLHRPYIDSIKLECQCGGEMKRVKEVMDVWFDSGAMPFAQDHYPFENKEWVEGSGYPADYISEAIDQTRGWFYTLLAVGVLMGKGVPYKNVICLGHILDAEGKKMSKSLGNVVDPWTMIEKYGVDTLRLWMYSVNQPGDAKNFDERTVLELNRQVFGLLYNVLAFYELYRDPSLETNNHKLEPNSNILDQWILARLNKLVKNNTENLDNYKLLEPVRAIKDFIGDLSTWYLRRSRDRLKDGDASAKQTLYFVLKTLAKLMAPFAPFSADDIWLKLKTQDDAESVHLSEWPEHQVLVSSDEVLENMESVRKIVSLGLEARQRFGIKVRQPLAKIEVKDFKLGREYIELIKDELNVKEVVGNDGLESEVKLDTEITGELKQEGQYREFLRTVQDMRKKMSLIPSDEISLSIHADENGRKIIELFEADLKKTAGLKGLSFGDNDGEEIKIDDLVFKIKIEK